MSMDMYLGAAIGRWALDEVGANNPHVRHIISLEEPIRTAAGAMGYNVIDAIPDPSDIAGGTGFSVHFPKIFKGDVIDAYDRMYNVHPGYLPYGRGYYPVFWALWEGTPAGGTLHEIVEGLDKGAVVEQALVEQSPRSTGGTLHAAVIESEKQLFRNHWKAIAQGEYPPAAPVSGKGSYHSLADFLALRDSPPLDDMSARDLIRLVRALTYAGRRGPLLDAGTGVMFAASLEPYDGENPA